MGWLGPALYVSWVVLAIGISLAATGLTPENVTRLLVVAFLLVQLATAARRSRARCRRVAPRIRFVVLGTLLAAVVEGFHMISKPVFASLRVDRATPRPTGSRSTALDLLFTVPAYVVIFSVIFFFVARYRYGAWAYAVGIGFAQTIGDGGLFFFAKRARPAPLPPVSDDELPRGERDPVPRGTRRPARRTPRGRGRVARRPGRRRDVSRLRVAHQGRGPLDGTRVR